MSREDRAQRTPGWRRTVTLAAHYLRFNLAAGMEYKASFLVQVLGMVLNNSAFIVFWLILFEQIGGPIRGYGFSDVMFLWSLSAAGYGIAGIAMGNAQRISRIIYSGELDVYLLQPVPVLPNLVGSRMSVPAWGDLAYGLVLFFLTQRLTVPHVVLFLIFALLMSFVLASLRVAYHSLTFFLGNAESFASMASEMLITFMLYPGTIFRGPTLWVLHSLIPAALVAYIPARLFEHFDPILFIAVAAADLAVVLLAFGVFRLGLKRYESGNRMGTRL